MISLEHGKFLVGNYAPPAIEIAHGKGTKLWDSDGKEYLDFTSGIAVTNLGHGHPQWTQAVTKQMTQLVHCSNLFSIPEQVRLAKRLVEKIGPGKVLFCNSGAEANEALLKLARYVGNKGSKTNRNKVVVAENGFHGRTLGALSATQSPKYRNGFEPLLEPFTFAALNDFDAFSQAIDDDTIAVLIESIQGEGGIYEAEDTFLQKISALCSQKGVLLLLDEVQAGIGRTGHFLGYQKAEITPNAVAMAKGLGGGFPIGAIWIDESYCDTFGPGSHGTTFGGSPLACSAANAVLDVLEKEDLIHAAKKQGEYFKGQLEQRHKAFPSLFIEVRGRGLMLALACHQDPGPMIKELRELGLLVVGAGGNAIRFLPPLTVSKEEINHALALFDQVLSSHHISSD
ncbi:MAG: aspartate aminotransferase family protein [Opitutales bacterium]|nr:aspartate aminotransferase family protein [Opitutales bacterium]